MVRAAILAALGAWLLWSAVGTYRRGRFTARGGALVTRHRNPAWFWASVLVQAALAAWLLWFAGSLVAQWRAGA